MLVRLIDFTTQLWLWVSLYQTIKSPSQCVFYLRSGFCSPPCSKSMLSSRISNLPRLMCSSMSLFAILAFALQHVQISQGSGLSIFVHTLDVLHPCCDNAQWIAPAHFNLSCLYLKLPVLLFHRCLPNGSHPSHSMNSSWCLTLCLHFETELRHIIPSLAELYNWVSAQLSYSCHVFLFEFDLSQSFLSFSLNNTMSSSTVHPDAKCCDFELFVVVCVWMNLSANFRTGEIKQNDWSKIFTQS
jgi:hypothetical protein